MKKNHGKIIIAVGSVILLYSLLMDTSVKVNYPDGNSFGFPERVNNLGLMAQQQMAFMLGCVILIVGVVVLYMSKPTAEAVQVPMQDKGWSKDCQCTRCGVVNELTDHEVLEGAFMCGKCGFENVV